MKKYITIQTIPTLVAVHRALREVRDTGDPALLAAADSTLSALIVVLRREEAKVPAEVGPHIDKLRRFME